MRATFCTRTMWGTSQLHSGQSIAVRFGLIGLPETFYVDRRGRIQDVTRGELSAATLQRALARASQN
jgi:hypothetical protein